MKQMRIGAVILAVATGAAPAQVAVQKKESPDKHFARTEIHVETMDRTLVPLTIETRVANPSATTTRTESITKGRLANGSEFVAQRATTVAEQVNATTARSTQTVTDLDRQGAARVTRQIAETVTKTADGEQRVEQVSQRNSSGELVPAAATTVTVHERPDGSTQTTIVEQERDVNGRLAAKRQVEETTVKSGANETVTTSRIQTYNHLRGRFEETAREVTTARKTGLATASERVISVPRGASWEVTGRVATTEKPTSDGGLVREVVQYGKPTHAQPQPTSAEPLKPKLKIIERYVQQSDGRSTQQREVFFWGVNNEWTPQKFSTATAEEPGGGR